MNNETYLTALKSKKRKRKTSTPQENETEDTMNKPPFLFEDYQKIHEKKTTTAQTVKDDFISYLIQEKTHCANFIQSEEYYQNKFDNYIKRYNHNRTLLQNKYEEYSMILLALEDQLLDFYIISDGNLIKHYKNLIDQVREKIRISEHDFECYQNSYRRLYKSNYLIKKRLEDEHKYQYSNDNQYEKYIILKNNALQSVIKQASLANNLYQFYGISTKSNEEEFAFKIKQYNDSEYEVVKFKNDLRKFEDKLKATYKQQAKLIEEISFYDRINKKGFNDYENSMKEYNVFKGKLLMLYSFLNVKNVNEFMIEVNNQRRVNQSLNSQFDKINDIISQYRIELSTLNSLSSKLDQETAKKHSTFTSLLNIKDSSNQLLGDLTQLRFNNNMINKKLIDYQEWIKRLLIFMYQSIEKIEESIENGIHKAFFTSDNCYMKYPNYFIYKKNNKMVLYLDDINYDFEFYTMTIELFWSFCKYLLVISTNCFNLIFKKQLGGINDDRDIVLIAKKKEKAIDSLYSPYVIVSHNDIPKAYKKELKNNLQQSQMKQEITSKNDNDKNVSQDSNQRNHLKAESRFNQEISAEDIYQGYLHYLDKESPEDNKIQKDYFKLYPRRSLVIVNRFSTHLIDKKKRNNTLSKARTIAKKSKSKPKEQRNNCNRSIRRYSEDSYEKNGQKDIHISPIIAPRKKQFGSLLEHEKYMLYYRMDDLRKLELNFFKNKNKESAQLSNYSEMFFQFKRRFNQSKEKKQRYDGVDSKYKGIELFKKKLKRNNSMIQLGQKLNLFSFPHFNKIINTGTMASGNLKDMNSTMVSLFHKGITSTTSKFNLTNRITTPESNFNKTYYSGLIIYDNNNKAPISNS